MTTHKMNANDDETWPKYNFCTQIRRASVCECVCVCARVCFLLKCVYVYDYVLYRFVDGCVITAMSSFITSLFTFSQSLSFFILCLSVFIYFGKANAKQKRKLKEHQQTKANKRKLEVNVIRDTDIVCAILLHVASVTKSEISIWWHQR